jgi:hypothetical protein
MLTRFVLGSVVSGGSLIFAMPLAFASLLSLRYPDRRVSALAGRADQSAGARVDAAVAEPTHSSVVAPERLESLRAARERKATAVLPNLIRAA